MFFNVYLPSILRVQNNNQVLLCFCCCMYTWTANKKYVQIKIWIWYLCILENILLNFVQSDFPQKHPSYWGKEWSLFCPRNCFSQHHQKHWDCRVMNSEKEWIKWITHHSLYTNKSLTILCTKRWDIIVWVVPHKSGDVFNPVLKIWFIGHISYVPADVLNILMTSTLVTRSCPNAFH